MLSDKSAQFLIFTFISIKCGGSDLKGQYEALLAEYEIVCKERETIKRDKDIANIEIRKIGASFVIVASCCSN
jgi:hypothetical protein